MGLPGMVLSAIAAAAGAIMYWAVTYQGTGFRLSTVGLILMIAGAGALGWGAQHLNTGYSALSRSLWWYNRDLVSRH